VMPSPGGDASKTADISVFEQATDHKYSAQGNLVGGHSPVWHGASPTPSGHNNPAAITGIRSKEFSGFGYNQLVFDDTDNQGRIQLKSTQHSSELNLGHLLHTADNYRGSFRGHGAELRTDAYGALRAGAGYLISSYSVNINAKQRDYAGDNTAGMAHLKHAVQLAENFSDMAKTHDTVQLSSHIGSHKAKQSSIATETKPEAPLKALHTATSGMVSQQGLDPAELDAQDKSTQPSNDKQPHTTDPLISLVGKAGLNITAGQHIQLANDETANIMSGEDSQFVTGEQFRVHTGQAIGMLAGAVSPGQEGLGLQLITGKDNTHIQAQSDDINIQAKNQVDVMSAHAQVDWAAAKSISMSTAAGANITIAGGNITIQCPGMITIHASQKSFVGPEGLDYPLPMMPASEMKSEPLEFNFRLADTSGEDGHALAHTPWKITTSYDAPEGMALVSEEETILSGKTDADGKIILSADEQKELANAYHKRPSGIWLMYPGQTVRINVTKQPESLSKDEELRQLLNAKDFSETTHQHKFSDGLKIDIEYAKNVLDAKTKDELIGKLNKL